MMGLENPIHLIFLLAVLLMVFGAKRLPEMGRGLGSGMRGFRDALSGHGDVPGIESAETTSAAPTVAAPIVAAPTVTAATAATTTDSTTQV
jgi:sec-independent protein translocase protein TatA